MIRFALRKLPKEFKKMRRLIVCALLFTLGAVISACSLKKKSPTSEASQPPQSAATQSPAKPEISSPQTQAGELQPGQARGTYTAKGEVVELNYAYAGRAERFGNESLIILVTDKPIPPEAVAEEIRSTPLLEGDKIRGLEYAIEENGMWVRYHPSQYQESGSNNLKEYKVESGIVRVVDENDGSLSNGRYARSVRFAAAIAK
jgi:hypothetical protein